MCRLRLHASLDWGWLTGGTYTRTPTGCGLCHFAWSGVLVSDGVCLMQRDDPDLPRQGVRMLERDVTGRRLEWVAANLRLAVANAAAVAERTGGDLPPVVTAFSTQEHPSEDEIGVILGCLQILVRSVDQREATNGPFPLSAPTVDPPTICMPTQRVQQRRIEGCALTPGGCQTIPRFSLSLSVKQSTPKRKEQQWVTLIWFESSPSYTRLLTASSSLRSPKSVVPSGARERSSIPTMTRVRPSSREV